MKRALTIVFVLALPLAALPCVADEPKAAGTATTTAAEAPKTEAVQPDSPLVAAAKRANRKGRKSTAILITNENLKTSGAKAHVTTTTVQNSIQMPRPLEPPRPTPEMEAAHAKQVQQQQVAEQAEKDRKAKEQQEQKAAQEAAARDDGYDGMQDDSAEVVGSTPPPPQF